MKMMSIPIVIQSKYQFISEGKASNSFSKHRAPPIRYFRGFYLDI